MNRKLSKFLAMMLIMAFSLSLAGCSKPTGGHSQNGNGILSLRGETTETEETEATEETEPSETDSTDVTDVDPTDAPDNGLVAIDASLTYPDHIATYEEIHPYHEPGTVMGQEASDLLDTIEHDILAYALESYVDLELTFENPENFGLFSESATWGDYSADNTYDIQFYNNIYEQLLTIDYENLDRQDRIFYDKLMFDTEESLYALQYTAFNYYTCTFDPLTGPQCDLMFLLAVFDFETVEDAENYINLVMDIDRYYDLILDFEEERAAFGFANSPSIYSQIAESFDALTVQEDDCFLYASFEERLNNISGLTDDERATLIAEHETAMHEYFFPEMQECSERMSALSSYNGVDRGLCEYPGGEAYYVFMFRNQTNCGLSVDDAVAAIDEFLSNSLIDYYMNTGTPSSDASVFSLGDMVANLNYLQGAIVNDFPALPEHSYFTMDVPEVFEDNFSPAAYLGYHLDNYDSNMIITNNASVGEDFGLTCAHEGYPGHMFQSVYTRSVCEHPYMYIADSIGYNEGWTEYIESYCYRYFTDDEALIASQKFMAYFDLLLMARCDIGIHMENWSAADCASYASNLFSFLGVSDLFAAEDLQDMYDLLLNVPNYATKYGVGYLNTSGVMTTLHEEFPDASDLDVHTAYLNALPGTYEQIIVNARAELLG